MTWTKQDTFKSLCMPLPSPPPSPHVKHCITLTLPSLLLPPLLSVSHLQSLWTLALQSEYSLLPGLACENNLLPPHFSHQHPCTHQHLPHGPLQYYARRQPPGGHSGWEWGRLLWHTEGREWRCDGGSEAHHCASGLWDLTGDETVALCKSQHLLV